MFLILVFFTLGLNVSIAQKTALDDTERVLIIGEDEGAYESLITSCPDMLFSVAGNSMEEAFGLWSSLLEEMQAFSNKEGFELKGIKMWINIFWNQDGSIYKIVYYPKPTSKNMDFQLLTDFLNDFAETYVLPTRHVRCFSHYGSATFPLFGVVEDTAKE